jgi:hypothetical protein
VTFFLELLLFTLRHYGFIGGNLNLEDIQGGIFPFKVETLAKNAGGLSNCEVGSFFGYRGGLPTQSNCR